MIFNLRWFQIIIIYIRQVSILFEPTDLWIGVYWKRFPQAIELYICIVPMIPIYVYVHWEWKE